MPSQRASLRLLELSPVMLPGALVVRQVPRRAGEKLTIGEEGEEEEGGEGGHEGIRTGVEAFRLPGEKGKR